MIGGFLDYSPGDSFLHRLNPLAKIFLSLMLCVSCFVTDSLYFYLFMILLDLAIAPGRGYRGEPWLCWKLWSN